MGIRITTDEFGVRVWRSDRYGHPNYSVSIQKKKDDGGYITEYKQIKFRGGVEVENGSDIIIRDGFPTIDTWNDKNTGELKKKEVWVIMDFHYRQEAPERTEPQTSFNTGMGERAYVDSEITDTYKRKTGYDDMPDTFQAAEDDIPF